ncbi:MAG: hypothetical protein WCT12_06485 [Verrucomicrobiota bacterium]
MKIVGMEGCKLKLSFGPDAPKRALERKIFMSTSKAGILGVALFGLFNLALAGQGDLLHASSGITFPLKIEQRFARGYLDPSVMSEKSVKVEYLYGDGTRVIVRVRPAPADAKGPRVLQGDSHSDATPSFMKEFESLKAKFTDPDDSARVVSQTRFHAALHKKGPVGMKATIQAKENHDILLCERNGYFVSFTLTYPKSQWLKYGLTYTDVAHFLGWPPLKVAGSDNTSSQKQ